MSYLDTVIRPEETRIAEARIHWFVYVPSLLLIAAAFPIVVVVPVLGLSLFVLGMGFLARAWLYCYSTELVVTSERVIAKFGFIRRDTTEVRLDKIESVQVSQGILGRMLDFGSVVVTGSGGTNAPIPFIAQPLSFRNATSQAQYSAKSSAPAPTR